MGIQSTSTSGGATLSLDITQTRAELKALDSHILRMERAAADAMASMDEIRGYGSEGERNAAIAQFWGALEVVGAVGDMIEPWAAKNPAWKPVAMAWKIPRKLTDAVLAWASGNKASAANKTIDAVVSVVGEGGVARGVASVVGNANGIAGARAIVEGTKTALEAKEVAAGQVGMIQDLNEGKVVEGAIGGGKTAAQMAKMMADSKAVGAAAGKLGQVFEVAEGVAKTAEAAEHVKAAGEQQEQVKKQTEHALQSVEKIIEHLQEKIEALKDQRVRIVASLRAAAAGDADATIGGFSIPVEAQTPASAAAASSSCMSPQQMQLLAHLGVAPVPRSR